MQHKIVYNVGERRNYMIKTLFLKVKLTLKIVIEAIIEGKAQRAKFYMGGIQIKN